ncbi:transposase [Streptomyces sp. BH055]|uniref:transposase n=1 Tax=Streptomyces sp. BH055 TaxID=3401173 RepID=UPI003BB600D7
MAEKVLATFPTCPIKEIKRLGKTLRQRREAFLAYFDTGRANNGGTEAQNVATPGKPSARMRPQRAEAVRSTTEVSLRGSNPQVPLEATSQVKPTVTHLGPSTSRRFAGRSNEPDSPLW